MYDVIFSTDQEGIPPEVGKTAWYVHYYTLGVLFASIMLFTVVNTIGYIIDVRKMFQRRRYFLVVNLLLTYTCIVMALCLLVDPYEKRKQISSMKVRKLVSLVIRLRQPCLIASFALIQTLLLSVSDVVLFSTWFNNIRVIALTTSLHFLLVLTTGISAMFLDDVSSVLLICDICMFVLFICSSIIALYSGIQILIHYDHNAVAATGNRDSRTSSNTSTSTTVSYNGSADLMFPTKLGEKNLSKPNPFVIHPGEKSKSVLRRMGSLPSVVIASKFCDRSIRKVAMLMVVTAMFGLVLCACIVVALKSLYRIEDEELTIWHWYALRTLQKLSECCIVAIMAYTVRRNMVCF